MVRSAARRSTVRENRGLPRAEVIGACCKRHDYCASRQFQKVRFGILHRLRRFSATLIALPESARELGFRKSVEENQSGCATSAPPSSHLLAPCSSLHAP